jgi:hypothetical protein
MTFKAEIKGLQADFVSGKGIITLETDKHNLTALSELSGELDVSIGKHREKRSLNANAYCWKLCTEIANELTLKGSVITKDEVYCKALKDYGQSDVVTVLSTVPAADYFKYYEEISTGQIKGKDYTAYRVYKGSSEYDTREMSILLDGIIADAEELGIHTITPKEAEQMKARWGVEV